MAGVDPNWLLANTKTDLRMFIGGWPATGYFPMMFSNGNFVPMVRPRAGVRARALAMPDGAGDSFNPQGFPLTFPHTQLQPQLTSFGFDLRGYSGSFVDNFLVFDDRWVFFQDTRVTAQDRGRRPTGIQFDFRIVDDVDVARQLIGAFDAIWDENSVLFLDASGIAGVGQDPAVKVAGRAYWDELIRRLAHTPAPLSSLDWRKFEELIAELLIRDGFDVELTPRSGDGGADVLAKKAGDFGPLLYVVQCKRNNPANPVKPAVIRELRTVVTDAGANKGIVATTSGFTSGARELERKFPNLIHLRDHDSIREWLRRHA